MPRDFTDDLLSKWTSIRPRLDMTAYEVTARISRIGLHIARRQDETFGHFGLNRGEVGVLGALRVAGPPHRLSPTSLFKGLMLSSAGMTSRLDRLERGGLVKRLPDPSDRRALLIELTDAGRKVVDEAVASNTKGERALLAGLTASEAASLAKLLRKMLAGLEPEALSA